MNHSKLFARTIFTVGYERASPTQFVDTLRLAKITEVLDVRELPLSRRKGFSKTSLKQFLGSAGIGYQHERALGAPRLIRHRLRQDRDLARYFAAFESHLRNQGDTLAAVATRITGSVALLCYERNPAECHRSLVAAALAGRTGAKVQHLYVPLDGERDAVRSPASAPRGDCVRPS